MSNYKEEKQLRKEKFEEIYYNDIGMCECGRPEEVKNFLYDLLKNHKDSRDQPYSFEQSDVLVNKRKEIIKNIDPDIIFEIIFHFLDKVELVEHGGSVYGSWYTEEGLEFLNLLSEFKDEE